MRARPPACPPPARGASVTCVLYTDDLSEVNVEQAPIVFGEWEASWRTPGPLGDDSKWPLSARSQHTQTRTFSPYSFSLSCSLSRSLSRARALPTCTRSLTHTLSLGLFRSLLRACSIPSPPLPPPSLLSRSLAVDSDRNPPQCPSELC